MVTVLRKSKIQSKGILVCKICAAYKYNLYIYSKFVFVFIPIYNSLFNLQSNFERFKIHR